MRTRSAKSNRICAYCGQARGSTDDHVPPRCIFPRQYRDLLLTVPCCPDCRDQQSGDEYLRDCLAIQERLANDARVEPLRQAHMRALARPEAARHREDFLRSMVDIAIPVHGGGLQLTPAHEVDVPRLNASMHRIIRGLFFKARGYALPKEAVVEHRFQQFGVPVKLIEDMTRVKPAASGGTGGKAFCFDMWDVEEQGGINTLWLTWFFDRLPAVGWTRAPGPSPEGIVLRAKGL